MKPSIIEVPVALAVAADEALAEGRVKYGPYSWRTRGESAKKLCNAVVRHVTAWYDGEEIDPESGTGKRHLAGAAASLAILLDAIAIGKLTDDRPTPGRAGHLLRDSDWWGTTEEDIV